MKVKDAASKLMLGTVQLGLDYGVSNTRGKVAADEAERILSFAHASGITRADTAHAYGDSESVIGNFSKKSGKVFSVVSKVSSRFLETGEIDASLLALKATKFGALLLHREDDLLEARADEVWKGLERAVAEKKTEKIGVSSYSPEKLRRILERYPLQCVQVPFNLLDRRFFSDELLRLYAERKTEVHVRSVFLQGLFFFTEETCPERLEFARPTLARLLKIAEKRGLSLPCLSMGCALSQSAVSGVVFGVTSAQELQEILDWPVEKLSDAADAEAREFFRLTEGRILDPLQWPLPDSK